MKLTALLTLAAVAVSVQAAAVPEPKVNWRICHLPGQACNKLKRAIESATPILEEAPTTADNAITKRAAAALASALAAAADFAEPSPDAQLAARSALNWRICHLPGQACNKKRDAAAEPEAEPVNWRICHLPGQACNKVKRAAEAVAEAAAAPEPEAEPVNWRICHLPGQACNKKRDAAPEPVNWRICHLPGQACNKAKRALSELEEAARFALEEVRE